LVVSTFGSQGAKVMNEMTAQLFALEQKAGFPFHHIHAVGKFGAAWMPQAVKDHGVDLENCPSVDMREYIYNMPTVLSAADVVLGRSGSGTCNEIAATGTPCILIPSPNVTNNHQEKNARILESRGAAIVVPEPECTAQGIFDEIMALMNDEIRRKKMSEALRSMVILDSAQRICDILEELMKS
jgi:UDP-N-acetylglucosamine--N-acetylmuramyl-(pentapeptide) pyrophosphoryl-undecaprenol N-acetylglucosamine transferase